MILTIGGATRDLIFTTQEGRVLPNPQDPLEEKLIAFEYGAKIKMEGVYSSLGGGASNVAIGLSRLGCPVKAIIRTGRDEEGREIKNNLSKEKVICSALQSDKKCPTGFSVIIVVALDDEHTAFLYRGANDFLEIKEKDFNHAGYLYLSSLTGDHSEEKIEKILELALKKKIEIFFNPGNDQLRGDKNVFQKILRHTKVLIVNLDEAREIALNFGMDESKLEYNFIFKLLSSLGVHISAITNAEHGARAYHQNKEYYQPASFPKTKLVDTTGAGDAFSSGFLAALLKDSKNIQQALKWGIRNAESVIQYYGAQQGLLSKSKILHPSINL